MKRPRFSEAKIVEILSELTTGIKATDLCRKYEISESTLSQWKSKFAGMRADEVTRLRVLEVENRRLKQLVADQAQNIAALRIVASGNF